MAAGDVLFSEGSPSAAATRSSVSLSATHGERGRDQGDNAVERGAGGLVKEAQRKLVTGPGLPVSSTDQRTAREPPCGAGLPYTLSISVLICGGGRGWCARRSGELSSVALRAFVRRRLLQRAQFPVPAGSEQWKER
jgi:hypothetical protein